MPLHSRRTPVRFSQRQLEARRRLSLSTSNDEADDCTSNDPFSTPQVRKTQQVKRRNKRRRLQCDSPSTSATAGVVITPEPTPSLSSFPISPTSAKRRRPLAERKPKLDNSSGRLPWSEFRDLQVPPHELRSSATLTTGQCFHWTDVTPEPASQHQNHQITSAWGVHNAKEWIGTLRLSSKERTHADTVVVHVRESEDTTMYRILCHFSSQTDAPVEDASPLFYDQMLREYFQLEEPLQPLYEEWATQCPRMRQIAQSIPGVRILQQDPWECLISFICSSNNNIPRITSMLQSIRQSYGREIVIGDKAATVTSSGTEDDDSARCQLEAFHTFPSPRDLSEASETELRTKCGLGYRAKYIVETTRKVLDWGGEAALWELRDNTNYTEVRRRLLELSGVGPKVADCVALFSLAEDTYAIPVDVHVWNICVRDYSSPTTTGESVPSTGQDAENVGSDEDSVILSKSKSLTPKLYRLIQDRFRQNFPKKTGWAHSLLFVAELPSFRPALPTNVLEQMDEFKRQEQENKKALKEEKAKRK